MANSEKRKSLFVIAIAGAALVVAVVWAGASFFGARTRGGAGAEADAAQNLRMTLDPALFNGQVKEAYTVAQRHPGLLSQLHCYCGCDKTDGHKNLLDCYRDAHGSHCAICVGEALDAQKMADAGIPVDQIRDTLRQRYSHGE